MASALDVSGVPHNPIDLIEEMVAANDWPFDRSNEQELVVGINADWCTYHLWFAWRHEPGVLHLCCAFDLKVPEERRRDVSTLVARINDSIWLGHFAMNDERSSVMFRHGQVMFAESTPSPTPYETLIEIALNECERYYPAFQFVIWGGKSPTDAIAAAMLETRGEA